MSENIIISTEPATGAELWRGNVGDVDAIVGRARRAWPAWAAQPLATRIELVRRFANEVRKEHDNFAALIAAAEKTMREGQIGPDEFFFRHRGGRAAADALAGYESVADGDPYWSDAAPQTMLIDEVEAIWAAIAKRDDWQPLEAKIAAVRRMGAALGDPPAPGGHPALSRI